MNENEIIEYLKQNKEKGTSFNFMPEDVRLWCITHKDESIFNVYYSDGWNIIRSGINCSYAGIYALPDDYKLKPEFKPHWEEFEIDCNGTFDEKTSGDFKRAYHWWSWVEFLNHNHDKYNNFGGYVYKELPQKSWQTFPVVAYNEKEPPIFPTKVRFWRYTE